MRWFSDECCGPASMFGVRSVYRSGRTKGTIFPRFQTEELDPGDAAVPRGHQHDRPSAWTYDQGPGAEDPVPRAVDRSRPERLEERHVHRQPAPRVLLVEEVRGDRGVPPGPRHGDVGTEGSLPIRPPRPQTVAVGHLQRSIPKRCEPAHADLDSMTLSLA